MDSDSEREAAGSLDGATRFAARCREGAADLGGAVGPGDDVAAGARGADGRELRAPVDPEIARTRKRALAAKIASDPQAAAIVPTVGQDTGCGPDGDGTAPRDRNRAALDGARCIERAIQLDPPFAAPGDADLATLPGSAACPDDAGGVDDALERGDGSARGEDDGAAGRVDQACVARAAALRMPINRDLHRAVARKVDGTALPGGQGDGAALRDDCSGVAHIRANESRETRFADRDLALVKNRGAGFLAAAD